ncbi:MAG: DNA gyrase inhibitor YacG [Candidatus Puniceispirillaceae bacterium]
MPQSKKATPPEKTKLTCPICKAQSVKPHSPFCSRRCAQIDLGHWLNEDYTIPAVEAMEDADLDTLLENIDKDTGLN